MPRTSTSTVAIALVIMPLLWSAQASAGISVDLAKKCRAMMVKAHPPQLFVKSHSAANERAYFKDCVTNNAKNDRQVETTGSSPQESPPTVEPDIRQ
jgi:hypothetical protein